MDKLKACPFCGGKARTHEFSWHASQFAGHMFADPYWQIICGKCRAAIGDFNSRNDAIVAWNTRIERTCHNSDDNGVVWFICSECGSTKKLAHMGNYCSYCGAKVMDNELCSL